MSDNTTSRRIRQTRIKLIKTYNELLREYESENITVAMLCERAEISRGTFYTHYSDIGSFHHDSVRHISQALIFESLHKALLNGEECKKIKKTEKAFVIHDYERDLIKYYATHKEWAEVGKSGNIYATQVIQGISAFISGLKGINIEYYLVLYFFSGYIGIVNESIVNDFSPSKIAKELVYVIEIRDRLFPGIFTDEFLGKLKLFEEQIKKQFNRD